MSIQIKLKNSVVQDSTPSASDLPEVGELALNGNINSIGGFMRASDNSIVKIFGPGSVTTPTATTTVSGISELATNSETTTGTATNRVVTPAGLNAVTVAERTTSNTNYVAKAGSTLTGVLTMPNGSNSAPAINFGDSDSGIFGGTNTVSLAAGGTTRLTADTGVSVTGTLAVTGAITSTSDLTIADKIIHAGDTDTAIRFPAGNTVSVETGGSEAIRVDSSGRVFVGTSSGTVGGYLPKLFVERADSAASIGIFRSAANSFGPFLLLGKSRASSLGGSTVVQDDDRLGQIAFFGADGTDRNTQAAEIKAEVDGTPGSNDMPGRLVFSTTADGAASPSERLRIDSAGLSTFTGNITITNSAPSIFLTDTDNNPDYILKSESGQFIVQENGGTTKFAVNTDGHVDVTGNLDVGNGIDVTGAIIGTGDMTIDTNTLHVDSSNNRVGIGSSSPDFPLETVFTNANSSSFSTSLAMGSAANADLYALHLQNLGTGNCESGLLFSAGNTQFGQWSLNCLKTGAFVGDLAFRTRTGSATSAERMRIDSSGQVGIGVTPDTWSTGAGITVGTSQGTLWGTGDQINLSGNAYFNSGWKAAASKAGASQIEQALGNINFKVSGSVTADSAITFTNAMRIDSSGRAGIGTTSPSAKLHIIEGTSTPAVKIKSGTSTNQNTHITMFNDNEGGTLALGVFGSSASTFGSTAAADGFISANNNLSVIAKSGVIKFGVGSTPNEKMRITSDAKFGFNLTPDASGGTVQMAPLHGYQSAATNLLTSASKAVLRVRTSSDSSMSLYVGAHNNTARPYLQVGNMSSADGGATAVYPLLLQPFGGDVGIGTSTPAVNLDVSAGSGTTQIYVRNTATSGEAALGVQGKNSSGTARTMLVKYDNNDSFRFATAQAVPITFSTSDAERMRINSDGNVSIGGNSSVGSKLHIENASGDAHIRLRGSANYGILFTRHSDAALTGYVGSGAAVNLGGSDIALSAPLSGAAIRFQTNGTSSGDEKARVTGDSVATFLIGTTTTHGIGWTLRGGIQPSSCNYNSTDIRGFIDFSSFHSTGSAQSKIFLQSDGKIYARTTTIQAYSSERRTKKNIVALNLEKAWNTLRDTPFYTFNFKDEIEGTALHHGPIVDECPEDLILPTQKEDEVGVINTVNSEKLQYRAYSALQQALKRIEELETKVKALQAA